MKTILLKTYDTIALYGLMEDDEIRTYQVESDLNHAYKISTFTDVCEAVEYFTHLKELSKELLFNKQPTVENYETAEDDIVYIDADEGIVIYD